MQRGSSCNNPFLRAIVGPFKMSVLFNFSNRCLYLKTLRYLLEFASAKLEVRHELRVEIQAFPPRVEARFQRHRRKLF